MNKNNMVTGNRSTIKYSTWKTILVFMALPILLNIVSEVIELTHFNTFNGAPFAERLANISMYVGNWPSLLASKYPYVIAGGGEKVYEVSGWMAPVAFIINMIGWGLVGFICGYAIRRKTKI